MLDHMILTVSDVERSLAFYEAALKPLNIKFFLPYKGEGDHPDLWGFGDGKRAFFWLKQGKPNPASIHWGFLAGNNDTVDEFYSAAISAGARDNISRGYEWNTIRDTKPPMYLTRTGIRLKSSTKASEEPHIDKMVAQRLGHKHWLCSSDRSSGHHRVRILESHVEQLLSMGMDCLPGGLECWRERRDSNPRPPA